MRPQVSCAALAALLAGCGGSRGEFEVEAGTRGAVAYIEYGGRQNDLTGLRVRAPGSRVDEKTFVNLAPLADGGSAASISLSRPFEDVASGIWTIDAPDAGAPLFVELIAAPPSSDSPPPLNLRFVIARGCVDDEPALRAELERAADFLPFAFGSKVSSGRLTIESVSLIIDCSLEELWLRTEWLSRPEREFTFVVTGQKFVSGLGGVAPIGVVSGRANAPLSMGMLRVPPDRTGHKLITLIMHELGHMAGLRHSVEADGSSDQLDDTPPCADPGDPNGNGSADDTECGVDAFANFMFWAQYQGASVSPAQLDVILRSPALGP